MTRPLRIEYPGAFYHVLNRGNAGEKIYSDKKDKEKFILYLEKTAERFSIIVHTYCLMPNHYHLLVETPLPNLSRAIQWLNVSYAVYYNRRYQRKGHLFHGRFKALLIDADEYLVQLSRYIHLNPVRAKMVTSPDDYQWCSYPAITGIVKAPTWLETGPLLEMFSKNKPEAIKIFKNFVEDIDIDNLENPAEQVVGNYVLGDTDFLNWVQTKFLASQNSDSEKEIPQLKNLKPRPSLKIILQAVCSEFECEEGRIIEKGGKKNRAREIAIYLSRSHTGLSCNKLGEFFGGISGAAITMQYNKVKKEAAHDKFLRDQISKIEEKII